MCQSPGGICRKFENRSDILPDQSLLGATLVTLMKVCAMKCTKLMQIAPDRKQGLLTLHTSVK